MKLLKIFNEITENNDIFSVKDRLKGVRTYKTIKDIDGDETQISIMIRVDDPKDIKILDIFDDDNKSIMITLSQEEIDEFKSEVKRNYDKPKS